MDIPSQFHATSPKETQQLGAQIANVLMANRASFNADQAIVVCLYGQLGSGKTTFTQGFAKALGYTSRLVSPTFLSMRLYELPDHQSLYHLDLYHSQESSTIRYHEIEEVLSTPEAIVVIEWPEKIANIVPDKRIDIMFTIDDEQHRTLHIHNLL